MLRIVNRTMSKLTYFFYSPSDAEITPEGPEQFVLAGFPIESESETEYDPFGFELTFRLDPRSQQVSGLETVTIPFTDLIEDSPMDAPAADEPVPPAAHAAEQLQFDLDVPDTGTATPKEPDTDALVLEMSRGEILGKILRAFAEDAGATFVTLTPQGIVGDTETIPYPLGVRVKGTGTARIRSECLWRLLGGTPPKPTWIHLGRIGRDRGEEPSYGLGEEQTRIRINGGVEIQSGQFTARIPTEP